MDWTMRLARLRVLGPAKMRMSTFAALGHVSQRSHGSQGREYQRGDYYWRSPFERNWKKFGFLNSFFAVGGIGAGATVAGASAVVASDATEGKEGKVGVDGKRGKAAEVERVPRVAWTVKPDSFVADAHFYPRVLNAQLHPMVKSFLGIGMQRMAERYCHMNPSVNPQALCELLHYKPKYLHWAGADLFVVASAKGSRQMCVIETNTCPSGQKSMPLRNDQDEQEGYRRLLSRTFKSLLLGQVDPALYQAGLAVVYDKNSMEATGYAATLADVTGEDVQLVEFYNDDDDPPVKFENGIMYVRVAKGYPLTYVAHSAKTARDVAMEQEFEKQSMNGSIEYEWKPIRAAFRYVTQQPWSRIPIQTKTRILNPVVTCLAGGRNKNVAAKAYEVLNAKLMTKKGLSELRINTPFTENDVDKQAVSFILKSFGGAGVVKVPYLNAGQGVFTITNEDDWQQFESDPVTQKYDRFIVQSLIGNNRWSSVTPKGRLYHVGTVPDKRLQVFAADIRMMVHYTVDGGWLPLCVYSRRARAPLAKDLKNSETATWDMLGTNLSVKLGENKWRTDMHRLMLMDTKDFNRLGIGMDDLIAGYVQTVLACIAIDQMAEHLFDESGNFDFGLFEGLNHDQSLIDEFRFNEHLEFEPTRVESQ